jgi:diguanylate cyclase (GGDEF)-like protein
MRRKQIDFRELLERLLPLEELPPADRGAVDRALRSGITGQLEQAALHALRQLEQIGALRRLPPVENGGPPALRYQRREGFDVITIQLPGASRDDGIVAYPRASLPPRAQASLDRVRRLLRIEDEPLLAGPRGPRARLGLLPHLDRAGSEFLGAHEVRLVPAATADEPPSDLSIEPELGREAAANPDLILYCPDARRSPRLARASNVRGVRAAVLAGLPHSGEGPLGHIEVLSAHPDPFRPEDLAMVALLADYCGGVMERAARLEKLVFIDPLTSAYNRSYFDIEVQGEMARAEREKSSMAICIADIDDFKKFNTTYGYEAGNQVLAHVALALKGAVRPFDTVARWGGEEFAVLLTGPIHAEDVVTISERLRQLVERQSVRLEGLDRRSHRLGVTVSIGVAIFPEHAEDPPGLWRGANQALLAAKRPPKNQVVFYRPPGEAEAPQG